MPDIALPPAPPAPPTPPPNPTPAPPAPAPDPMAPQQIRTLMPEDDPNHHMAQLISRRRVKKAEGEKAGSEGAGERGSEGEEAGSPPNPHASTPAAPAAETPPKAPPVGLNALIARTLKHKPEKPDEKKVEPEAPAPAAETVTPPAPAPKTVVKKKAAAPAAPAAPDITEITTAATTAAVRAMREGAPKPEAAKKPEADLKPDDLHDYEVAQKLAELNPKYKDAPRVVLEQVRRSEQYAARWETANPGKEFDPDADEHNEFYDGLEKPWSDHEFRNAEIEMAAERVAARTTHKSETRIKALEQDNARLELTPIVERTFVSAAGLLARELQVEEKLKSMSFDKLLEEDPVTAEALAHNLGPLKPIIETIVQLDDPKGRFPLDENNPAHQEWMRLLGEKEAQFAGVENEGKMFATRIAFSRMTNVQRARHWYLTADHLVSEVVGDAAAAASERVKAEKEKVKKMAASMGYTLTDGARTAAAGSNGVTQATNGEHDSSNGARAVTPAPAHVETIKPLSPSVGSGAKIDTKGGAAPAGRAATLAAMGDILFRPGRAVP